MSEYRLWRYDNLLGTSIESDNLGQTPQTAKYRKHFVNIDTAVVSQITDLQSRKFKRNKYIESFIRKYQISFKNQKVSILALVVNDLHYESISKFLNMFGKKLSRKQILKLGYVWVRDVGEINFEPHFHILVATSRICPETFKKLFAKKKRSHFDVEFLRNPNGLKAYLTKKELYGSKRKRAFGKSMEFKNVN